MTRGRRRIPVVSQAIAWWVRLQSGVASADELRSCGPGWPRTPRIGKAWGGCSASVGMRAGFPSALAHAAAGGAALARPPRVACELLAIRAWPDRLGRLSPHPWQRLAADLSTGIGERPGGGGGRRTALPE